MHNKARALRRNGSIQRVIGWGTLSAVLASALALGANRPVSWLLLGLVVLAFFATQIVLDLLSRRPATFGVERLWLPALLYIGATLWGFAQTVPGWMPEAWLHPAWAGLELLPAAAEKGQPTVSADPIPGRHHVIRLATYAAVFWIMVQVAADAARSRAMVQAVALFSGVLAAYGIGAWAVGVNPILGEEYTANIVKASFVNRNSFAVYATFGGLANLAALAIVSGRHGSEAEEAVDVRRSLRDVLERFFEGGWLYALGALLCFAAVALTQSRGGAAAAFGGVVVFLAAYRRQRDWGGAALIGAAAVILGFVMLALSTGITGRFLTAGTESLRFAVYPEAFAQALERAWLGHGLGSFYEVFRAKVPFEAAVAGEWDFAHNTYFENLFELGFPATIALYTALAIITSQLIRGAIIRRRNRLPVCFALGVTTASAIHSLVDFSLQMPATAALYAAIIGIGWAQSRSRRAFRDEVSENQLGLTGRPRSVSSERSAERAMSKPNPAASGIRASTSGGMGV